MLTMNFTEDSHNHLPLYRQLAEHFKKEIRLNHIAGNAKLPSIRKLAAALNLSRTTVETAYSLLLAEGYILSQPKRGYVAVNLAELPTSASVYTDGSDLHRAFHFQQVPPYVPDIVPQSGH